MVGNLDVTQPPSAFSQQLLQLTYSKQFVGIRIGRGMFQRNAPPSFAGLLPNVIANLTTMAKMGLQIDANGVPGVNLSQIGRYGAWPRDCHGPFRRQAQYLRSRRFLEGGYAGCGNLSDPEY